MMEKTPLISQHWPEPGYGMLDVRIKAAVNSSGVAWAIVWMQCGTEDGSGYLERLFTMKAPDNGSIGAWSVVSTWDPTPGTDIYPQSVEWDSVVLSDGAIYWEHWDGSAHKVYSKTL